MNRILVGLALAGALWGCEAKSAPPPVVPPAPVVAAPAPAPAPAGEAKLAAATYTERVKIDDV